MIGLRSVAGCRSANQAQADESGGAEPDTSLSLAEADSIVRGEFGGMVVVDSTRMKPPFLVGDFDGDGRSDLVVIGQWVSATSNRSGRQHPVLVYVPLGTGMPPEPGDLRVSPDRLTNWRGSVAQAVIHDFRGADRSPRRESVIILFAVNSESVLRRDRSPLAPAIAGDEPELIPPRTLRGDAILMLRDDGEGAALYWDGERYRWYPVNGKEDS